MPRRLAWPVIVARHVDVLPVRPAWQTVSAKAFDGPATTGDILDSYLTIGWVEDADTAVTWEQTPDGEVDGLTRENGTIACELTCSGGGDDVPAIRARLGDLLDDWMDWLLEDNTQGGGLLGHSRLQLSADIGLQLTDTGATAKALVALDYTAVVNPT